MKNNGWLTYEYYYVYLNNKSCVIVVELRYQGTVCQQVTELTGVPRLFVIVIDFQPFSNMRIYIYQISQLVK